jgi:HK97 family phage prohead protease
MTERADFRLAELKLAPGSARTFTGYGAVFNNVDAYGDAIAPGAFKATLAEHRAAGTMPALLSQHGDWSGTGPAQMPIGVWTTMREDEKGLFVEGRLSDTPRGLEAHTLLKDGALSGLSIGYVTRKSTPGAKAGDAKRTLTDVELLEVSLVTFPANPLARVASVKAVDGKNLTLRELEHALQSVGVPRRLARKLIHPGWQAVTGESVDSDALQELADHIKSQTKTLSQLFERN